MSLKYDRSWTKPIIKALPVCLHAHGQVVSELVIQASAEKCNSVDNDELYIIMHLYIQTAQNSESSNQIQLRPYQKMMNPYFMLMEENKGCCCRWCILLC